jgi:hypothetical protein
MGLTRRSFLTRAGVAAAAAAGVGTWELVAGGSRGLGAGLSLTRRRTYMALVDAVGRGSRSQVDPSKTAAAAKWLRDERYPSALEHTRRAIEDVLDRIEIAPPGRRRFSELDPVARLATLRALAADPDERRRNLAGRAVALAAAPFHPPAGDYHPTPMTL